MMTNTFSLERFKLAEAHKRFCIDVRRVSVLSLLAVAVCSNVGSGRCGLVWVLPVPQPHGPGFKKYIVSAQEEWEKESVERPSGVGILDSIKGAGGSRGCLCDCCL